MQLFNEEERKLVDYMCPSCKDLGIILEKVYNREKYLLTEEQIFNLNHGCFDLEKLQVGTIIKNMCELNNVSVNQEFINCLNKGENCPVLNLIGNMGDYFATVINSLNKETRNEFDFQRFVEQGNYSGIEYISSTNEKHQIYEYLGEDEYLYYKEYIPYNSNYVFSYQTSILGSISIRFFDENFNNISFIINEEIKYGTYNEKELSIIIEGSKINLPYIKNKGISYFMIGFKVEKDSYFSNIILQKQ
jgi:hypothetical protein